MIKKLILSCFLALTMVGVAFAAEAVYNCEEDSCGKCVVSHTSKKCGKCGGKMYSRDMKSVPGTSNLEAWFECERCGHHSKWTW